MSGNSRRQNRQFEPARLRRTVLEMAYAGSTVHIACAFSIIEILAVLYRDHLRYPDDDPVAENRDYLVLSKGHGVMAQYACMRELGWVSEDQVSGYFADGSDLKGLSDSRVPGLEVTSGSLGHGLSVGVGLALAAQRKVTEQKVYAIVGDGEMNEGAIWEAMLLAAHHKLDNLMILVDKNDFQAMGRTDEVVKLGSLASKFDAFGFECREVDGHDEAALGVAISTLGSNRDGRPKAIVAQTVKGKGVGFMEADNRWHYTRLDSDSFGRAITALEEQQDSNS
jgi:transketolase